MVAACVRPAFAIKAAYERFEQLFGNEYIDFDVRVRKFNRTEMTLNGTVHVKQPIDNTIVFSTDVFLSRLGNQQFQHYPMHLPTGGFCEFIDHLHEEYPTVIVDIVNIPQLSECPITERSMHIQDKLFPTEALPESLSSGLWKMVISGTLNETVIIRFTFSIRLTDDYMTF
uniref:Uncharacterized protein n=1 Tax=Anopheles funestus TaxID=62324 RepID=A0A182RJZ2_ANOFN